MSGKSNVSQTQETFITEPVFHDLVQKVRDDVMKAVHSTLQLVRDEPDIELRIKATRLIMAEALEQIALSHAAFHDGPVNADVCRNDATLLLIMAALKFSAEEDVSANTLKKQAQKFHRKIKKLNRGAI